MASGEFSPVSNTGKWVGFVAAVWIQAISGNNYTFSNYSNALKSLMSLTQIQLNTLSVAKDAGKAFGLLAGVASDRFPASVIVLVGALLGLLGYAGQWLVVSHRIKPLPFWQMCVILCIGGNSSAWMNTAVLVTCIRNFRKNRGPVSGILKGFIGLSTAIFTDLCSALFADDPSLFLLMLCLIPFAVCLAGILFLREVPPSSSAAAADEESKYFGVFNVLAVVTAVYLLAFDFVPNPSALFSRSFAVGLLVLLASPVSVPVHCYIKHRISNRIKPDPDIEGRLEELLLRSEEKKEAKAGDEGADNTAAMKRRPAVGEEHTIMEAMKSVDFWILYASFLCGVGSGLAVMNNMGQIGLAFGYTDVSIFVSLTSIWGFFGRIISGSVSEYFIKKAATPRPLWNAASQVLMATGFILLAMALPASLHIGSILIGISYGVRLAITVPTASELFGLKYYGLLYNILILNLPLGSFLFSGLLVGILYDREASAAEGGGNNCIGSHCFRLVFIVMAGACIVGFFLDIVSSIRAKNVYAKISLAKRYVKP